MPANRKPTAILEASGAFRKNPKRRADRENEPKPAGPLGNPPDWLNDKERECWREILEEVPPGVLTKSDGIALATAASLYATIKARKAKAADRTCFRHYLTALGLTAVGRSNMSVPPTENVDPFADL